MFFSTRPSLAELQEATLSGVAEAVYPLVEQRPASMPAGGSQQQTAFTQQVPRRLPSSGSGSLLSRRFTFYYWSVQSEDCFSIDCFLTDHAIPTPPKTDHAVSPLRGRAATQVVRAAKQLIIVHSPKHISKLVITDDTTDLALAGLVLDREGFLKTPTVRVGNTVVIGYATSVFKSSLFFGNGSPTATKKASRIKRLRRGASQSLVAPFKAIQKSMTSEHGAELQQLENDSNLQPKTPKTPKSPKTKRQKVTSHLMTSPPLSPAAAWAVGVASPPLSPSICRF